MSVVVRAGEAVVAASSTDLDGTYEVRLPAGTYRLVAELIGFVEVQRDLVVTGAVTGSVAGSPCRQTLDLTFTLTPRTTTPRTPAAARPPQPAARAGFETLQVQQQAAAAPDVDAGEPAVAAVLLLPPGFSDGPTDSVVVNGNAASVDRGQLGDRLDAIGRGDFDPAAGGLAAAQAGAGAPPGGRGGQAGPQGRGGGPGGGPLQIAGRGGQQRLYTATSNYTFNGSALDASPYQLRADSRAIERPYTRQGFGFNFGGPIKIPGVYDGTRRTTFMLAYNGNRGADLFDQYATVPSDAWRTGDFSSLGRTVIDPLTGQPFPNNQIPLDRMDPGALVLLRYIPPPNLSGATRNFHYTTTTGSLADNANIRVTHNFTPPPSAGRGAAAGGRGGAGGRAGGAGAAGGRGGGRGAQTGTTVTMNVQLQYRRNSNDRINVFPTLGGDNSGSSLTVPIGFNIGRGRTQHTVNASVSETRSTTVNRYAFVENVAGEAGIGGVATDPFTWGVPTLSFSSLSSVNDLTPSRRTDRRLSLTYGWTRPIARHTLRFGGDWRNDTSSSQTDANARGSFVFTGLYSGGGTSARAGGLDFADFLLGLPQQASVQFGPGSVDMRGRSLSLYVQDDWRRNGTLTFNLGLRYELVWPFLETTGQMVNLDVAPDFSGAAPVISGATGPFSGQFPDALVTPDLDNLAPRVGVAWRAAPGLIVRGGYSVAFNAGSYSSIARQLVSQPPFAVTNTSIGAANDPLTLAEPFADALPTLTTNNFGVAVDYRLGRVQTWNTDVARDFWRVWNVGGGYTYVVGSSLDIVRAPNRGPEGLRIANVQSFLWQTSEGSSRLHTGVVRLNRRAVRGIGGGVTYTLARSMDNASSLGAGQTQVAQDDQNLDAEWSLSSFDRRHQVSGNMNIELPFGPNRRWFSDGGVWAALLRDWSMNTTITWQSGTPYTPRVLGAASDVARGTNGTLRADYTGAPIPVSSPTIDKFFNTTAFSIPEAGTFGDAGRNLIVGPGSRDLNAQLSRSMRMGNNRSLTVQLRANNLLNQVNYSAIDTVVNSPTFGQVTSVRPMRSTQLTLRFQF